MNLKELFAKFIKECEYVKNLSPATLRSYQYAYDAWDRFNGELSDDGLSEFIYSMREAGLKPGACNVYIRSLNVFFNWLHQRKLTQDRFKLPLLKEQETIIPIFSDEDIKRILRWQPKSFYDWRLWVMCNTMLDTGMRISECMTLKKDLVDWDNLLMTITEKGRHQRKIPFSPELRKILYHFNQIREVANPGGQWMFPTSTGTKVEYRNFHRDLVVLCQKLKIVGPRVSPHSFRHYFSANWIRQGGSIYDLSRLLGHSSVTVTEVYLKSIGIEHFQKEQGRFTPLSKK